MKSLLIAVCVLIAGSALAETTASNWKELGSIPLPSWQTVPDPMVESVQDTQVTGPKGRRVTIFELMPKGQNDRNWRKRHWIVTFENVVKTPKAVMNSTLRRLGKECATKVHFADFKRSKGAQMFVVYCGRLKGKNLGQVSMIWLGKTGTTLVRVSEEWRGAPYDAGNLKAGFWRKADLRRAVKLIGSTRLK